jgi:LysR family transcriptional regulator, benzoate and cis,cis-muconate-responsive activator of ben and cat genes
MAEFPDVHRGCHEMTLRHLRAFVAVAEELSFTSAARRLHISQPPLSRQIQQLETEIGAKLFARSSQGIALTAKGQWFLGEVRQLTSLADEFLESAQRVRREGTGAVRVGIDWALWKAVNRIRTQHARQHPGVDIIGEDLFRCGDALDVAQAFRWRRIDVALTRVAVEAASIECEPLFSERIVVLIRADHPLARAGSVRLRQLANETLMMPGRKAGPVSCEKVIALYEAAGITPRLIHTHTGPIAQSGLMLVSSGEGFYVSVGGPFTQPHAADGVAMLTLDEPNATIPVLLAFRRNESCLAALDFVQSARDAFRR